MYVNQTSDEWKRVVKKPSTYTYASGRLQKRSTDGCTKERDNNLHRLLFLPNGLPDGAELACYVIRQRLLGGYKQRSGIVCSCCDIEIRPSRFEAHAGMAARCQPYHHMYTPNGLTLYDIALSLENGQNLTTGDSDDMCAICGEDEPLSTDSKGKKDVDAMPGYDGNQPTEHAVWKIFSFLVLKSMLECGSYS